MYLKEGREIYESDRYPGYYIDANTGAFCDERGNYIGGNIDDENTIQNTGNTTLDSYNIIPLFGSSDSFYNFSCDISFYRKNKRTFL